ncbi:MAG: hypothetical protein U0270_25685, partial [Labilithrix sp.]
MGKQPHPEDGNDPDGPPVWRGDPTRGADLIAPTAPHARPRRADEGDEGVEATKRSGPAKFWSRRRVRVALAVASLLSISVHWYIAPWNLLPSNTGVEFKDPAGDLAIPVDILGEDTPPPPPPAPPRPPAPPPAAPPPPAHPPHRAVRRREPERPPPQ